MRAALSSFALVSALASAYACAGETPPPKAGSDTASTLEPKGEAGADAAASNAASEPPKEAPIAPTPAPTPTAEPPPAEDDPWQAFRQMPSNDILKTMKAARGKVQACIHAGQKRDPSESGEVKIKFVVVQKGDVVVWKDDGSSMNDEETTKCIGEVIKALHFPGQKMPGHTLGAYSIHVSP